jgi:hypothetical protein
MRNAATARDIKPKTRSMVEANPGTAISDTM